MDTQKWVACERGGTPETKFGQRGDGLNERSEDEDISSAACERSSHTVRASFASEDISSFAAREAPPNGGDQAPQGSERLVSEEDRTIFRVPHIGRKPAAA